MATVPKDGGTRIGEVTASPTTAGSGTEAVRGMIAVSPSIADNLVGAVRGTAVASPTTAVNRRAAARGVVTVSTTTAAVRAAAVLAGTIEDPSIGGSRIRAGGAHPGAVTTPGRPPGPTAVGMTTRLETGTSGRGAALEGPPAP